VNVTHVHYSCVVYLNCVPQMQLRRLLNCLDKLAEVLRCVSASAEARARILSVDSMLVMKRLYLLFVKDLQNTVFIYPYQETFVRLDFDN